MNTNADITDVVNVREIPAKTPKPKPQPSWRDLGMSDPHNEHYDHTKKREDLAMGHLSDDMIAYGAFMYYNAPLDVERIIARDPNYFSPIGWMTAAKERLRWLSRRLWDAERRIEIMEGQGIPVPAIEAVPQAPSLEDQIAALKIENEDLHEKNGRLCDKLIEKDTRIKALEKSAALDVVQAPMDGLFKNDAVGKELHQINEWVQMWERSGITRKGAIMQSVQKINGMLKQAERKGVKRAT